MIEDHYRNRISHRKCEFSVVPEHVCELHIVILARSSDILHLWDLE